MLNQSTVSLVTETAQVFALRNLRLVPIADTPVSELTRCALKKAIVLTAYPTEGGEAASFNSLLVDSANEVDGVGACEHDTIMTAAIEAASGALNFNNNLARNIVNPAVERVSVSVVDALSNLSNSVREPVEVVSAYDRLFWTLPFTQEMLARFEETPLLPVTYTGPAIPYTDGLLLTGLATLDDAVAQYASELAATGELATIWDRAFGRGPFKCSDALEGSIEYGIDAGLVLYLAATALEQNPPTGTEMSATDWSTMLTEVKVQAGRMAWRNLSRLIRGRERNELVRSYPPSIAPGSKIVVDEEVYRRFKEAGGTAETLKGALVSDRNTLYSALLEHREAYQAKWNIASAALSAASEGQRWEIAIKAVERAVAQEINDLSDEDLIVSKAALHKNLHEYLRNITTRDIEDPWNMARKVICRVIFPHTEAEAVLLAIDEQKRLRPELDIREAAFYAAIDQLALWLSKLIRVESTVA